MATFLRRHAAIVAVLAGFGGLYFVRIDSYGMLRWDEAQYASLGRSLIRGLGYTNAAGAAETFRPPVVPAASALSMVLSRSESDAAAKLPIVVFALLCLLLVYGSVQRYGDTLAGITAAIALGIFPEFWTSTPTVLTEIPFMLFYGGAVVFFHEGLFRNPRAFLYAWPCWALAMLTRYTAVLFGPTVLLLMLVPFTLGNSEAVRRMRSKEFFLGPIIAFLMLAPWIVRTWAYTGNPLSNFVHAGGQLAYGHSSSPTLYYLQCLPAMIGWIPLVLLAAAILYMVIVRQHTLGIACCIAVLVVVGWMQQYGYKGSRLINGILPFFAILIGLGVAAAVRKLPGSTWVTRALVAVMITAFVINYREATTLLTQQKALGYPSFLHAMADLKKLTPANALVLGTNCHQIYWYSDRLCRRFPGDEEALVAALDGIDWAVITNFERDQPEYLRDVVKRVSRADPTGRSMRPFADNRWATVLVPALALRAQQR